MNFLRLLWSSKEAIGVGALIVGLCILFGWKEAQLGASRLDLATAQASIATLHATIKIQNGEVARLGEATVAQRLEVARLLKLVQPKAKALTDAAAAAKVRAKEMDGGVFPVMPESIARTSVSKPSVCKEAIFDAAKDMEVLK